MISFTINCFPCMDMTIKQEAFWSPFWLGNIDFLSKLINQFLGNQKIIYIMLYNSISQVKHNLVHSVKGTFRKMASHQTSLWFSLWRQGCTTLLHSVTVDSRPVQKSLRMKQTISWFSSVGFPYFSNTQTTSSNTRMSVAKHQEILI